MATIGLIAGSYKPYHAGHAAIIELAARECDEVHLYVSVSDRARKGELPILGADMAMLWKATIEKTLPQNVKVTYGGSPIGNVWKELGAANEAQSQDDYVIYSDPVDLAENFQERLLNKYCGDLYSRGHVRLRPVDRANTVEVSGTKMRELLAKGDKESFVKFLPKGIDADLVWDTLLKSANSLPKKPEKAPSQKPAEKPAADSLKKKPAAKKPIKGESLLRRYINLLFGRR